MYLHQTIWRKDRKLGENQEISSEAYLVRLGIFGYSFKNVFYIIIFTNDGFNPLFHKLFLEHFLVNIEKIKEKFK